MQSDARQTKQISGWASLTAKREIQSNRFSMGLLALEIDFLSNEAALNLGVIEAQAGNADGVISLWQGPFDRIPGRSEVGMNLVLLYCSAGKMEKARATITQVLKFNSDLTSARKLQRQLNGDPATCDAR
jgi:hypothetical protein